MHSGIGNHHACQELGRDEQSDLLQGCSPAAAVIVPVVVALQPEPAAAIVEHPSASDSPWIEEVALRSHRLRTTCSVGPVQTAQSPAVLECPVQRIGSGA